MRLLSFIYIYTEPCAATILQVHHKQTILYNILILEFSYTRTILHIISVLYLEVG